MSDIFSWKVLKAKYDVRNVSDLTFVALSYIRNRQLTRSCVS